jgi:hypothetical protein
MQRLCGQDYCEIHPSRLKDTSVPNSPYHHSRYYGQLPQQLLDNNCLNKKKYKQNYRAAFSF